MQLPLATRQDPRRREPLRRRLLGHDPRAAGARVELLGRARRQPDPAPPRLPARHAPGDAAVPARVASARSASSTRALVTLLFYALAVVLAARLPAPAETRGWRRRGVAALNPLVYWHQIFGANDLVFVAMLLGRGAAAARAADARRRRAAGARLRDQAAGLAVRAVPAARSCSGAGSFRELVAPAAVARGCCAPLAALPAVFARRRAPGGGPRLPGLLGRHRRLQRRAARGRQLPARRHAGLRLRELPDLLRPRREPAATTSRSRSSTSCSCRSGLLLVRAQLRVGRAGAGARDGQRARSSPRSTSRASCTRTT